MCLCYVVPPHMMQTVSDNVQGNARPVFLRTISLSSRLRGQRDILTAVPQLVSPGQKLRSVYHAENRIRLPGVLVRSEGTGSSGDQAADEAFEGAGHVYDFLESVMGRKSIDQKGMRIDATVHYGHNWLNAFWNGQQLVAGDGDGTFFDRFTASLDVIAHELGHGVIQYDCDLEYKHQSGALNEHFADVIGTMVKQWVKNQAADQADWLIGDEIFAPDKQGVALRSLKEPGTAYGYPDADPILGHDPQPRHMKDYIVLDDDEDDGGVHINSGIPNHAFYLAAIEMGGRSWEKVGRIWYIAMHRKLTPSSQFHDAAMATMEAAAELFGEGSKEQDVVRHAWEQVGIYPVKPAMMRTIMHGGIGKQIDENERLKSMIAG